jgi:hypothetical protein
MLPGILQGMTSKRLQRPFLVHHQWSDNHDINELVSVGPGPPGWEEMIGNRFLNLLNR